MLSTTETLAEKFARKGLWLYLFTFLLAPIGYVIKIILSHDLSVSDIGAMYGIISLLMLLTGYSDLGMAESLNYFIPKFAVNKEYRQMKYILLFTFIIHIVSGLLLGGAIYFGATWLAVHYFHNAEIVPLIQIASLFFIGSSMAQYASVLFSALQYVKLQKSIEALRLISTLIGVLIIFFAGSGSIVNYMWCWIMGVILGSILGFSFALQYLFRPYLANISYDADKKVLRDFLKYSLATFLTVNVTTLLSQIDTQLVLYFLGTTETGYYSNYLSLIGIPFIFLGPIIGFLLPVFSELSGKKDKNKIALLYQTVSLYFWIIGIWLGVFFLVTGPLLSVAFFSDKFRESGSILQYSAPFLVFNLLVQLQFQVLSGIGKARQKLLALTMVLPLNVILNLIFIFLLDMEARGSALAVGLSWIPLYLMGHYFIREYVERINTSVLAVNFFGALLFGGGFYFLTNMFTIGERYEYLAMIVFAFLSAFGIFLGINFRLMKEFVITFRAGLIMK